MWLFSRWIARVLAAPKFFDSYEAVGLIATGVTLYALYMVLVVILGRTGRTEFNFPATIAALAANIALNLLLVPSMGIVGAGLALVASYVVVVALMYVVHPAALPGPLRMEPPARVLLVSAALVALGELAMPTEGLAGLLGRGVVWALFPLALLASGFFSAEERRWLALLRHPGELIERLRAASRKRRRRGRRRDPRGLRGRADRRRPALLGGSMTRSAVRMLSPRRSGRAPGGRGPSRRGPAGRG